MDSFVNFVISHGHLHQLTEKIRVNKSLCNAQVIVGILDCKRFEGGRENSLLLLAHERSKNVAQTLEIHEIVSEKKCRCRVPISEHFRCDADALVKTIPETFTEIWIIKTTYL